MGYPLSLFMEVSQTAFRLTPAMLTARLQPLIEAEGYEWVGCHITHREGIHVRLFVDLPEGGITLDQVEQVARLVDPLVEELEGQSEGDRYYLEVSSPGIERPLFTAAHYARFIGQPARARFFTLQQGQRKVEGLIQAVEGDRITFETDQGPFTFPLEAVSEARLVFKMEKGQKKTFKKGGNR